MVIQYVRIRWLSLFLCAGIALLVLAEFLPTRVAIVGQVDTVKKIVALTFDDGPDPVTTQALLEVLAKKQVKATFFLLGSQVEAYPELAANITRQGHEVGSHNYSHVFLNRVSLAEFLEQVGRAEAAISKVAPKPVLFRPPGGGYNDKLVEELQKRGYTTVLWSVDPRDWEGKTAEATTRFVLKQTKPGSIILLHEGSCARATPEAVSRIIEQLAGQGYSFVTVSELLNLKKQIE
ncbi:polysaccharide deacetylase family protein [Propionispora hippei]|uniref:Peptidoglycan/xylan/chitin deacetylase, PgdA/CDA1 family n=1 Tax=Propionispora hippei DSM 15287 TaxID=1123003 RepID=A0A1M6LF28_9FIRM|nr:polysaccharide deacetylase family protein [Propionispora hippei]SHJ69685.1 Peptidoglycan/xylan/chitin deacetylase, PgdA/CDA1 family [Propionispora hippei DSM 15287]